MEMENASDGGPRRPFRTLLAENEGRDYDEYKGERGAVRLWHLGNRIGIFESSGGIDDAHARFIVRYFERHIESSRTPWYAFGNWMELRGYTPETRKVLTDWQTEQAASYAGLFVAHNSKLVGMSINFANAALKNQIRVYNDEERLDDQLIEVRARLRL